MQKMKKHQSTTVLVPLQSFVLHCVFCSGCVPWSVVIRVMTAMSRALKKARGVAPMPGMMMPGMMPGMIPGMGMMQPPPLTAGDESDVEEDHGPAAAPTPARATVVAEHEPPSAGPAIAGHLPEDGQHHHERPPANALISRRALMWSSFLETDCQKRWRLWRDAWTLHSPVTWPAMGCWCSYGCSAVWSQRWWSQIFVTWSGITLFLLLQTTD